MLRDKGLDLRVGHFALFNTKIAYFLL
jgi:hypothetical protein